MTTPPNTIHVLQGEYRLSRRPQDLFSTLLGSCVATCVYDPVVGVGAMNHFLLPGGAFEDKASLRYGVNSMEQMINALLKEGADRRRLEAKIFGGGRMLPGLRNIGQDNVDFARWFLNGENIRCVGESVGGTQGRKVRFWPSTGQAQIALIGTNEAPPVVPDRVTGPPSADPGSVTLF
ncbi:chemotaxis protein CheD [Plastorhodobacter daqingensis]|uniref:Probable chemoreceptor glutamine deamidase CheD n=1 Tax=Plastorhodobacter daqingensis TaxID=1387281 RepID=A0ABW2UMH5_9RHOB